MNQEIEIILCRNERPFVHWFCVLEAFSANVLTFALGERKFPSKNFRLSEVDVGRFFDFFESVDSRALKRIPLPTTPPFDPS